MGVLVAGEEVGRGGGDVAVAVAVVVGAAVAVEVAVAVVVAGAAAAVGGGRRDYNETDWGGGTRGVIVEVGDVGVDGPRFEIGEDSRMGMFVDRGPNKTRKWRGGVVAGQGAWMVPCRCGREIGREGFDGVVVVVVDVGKLSVGSSFERVDVEA